MDHSSPDDYDAVGSDGESIGDDSALKEETSATTPSAILSAPASSKDAPPAHKSSAHLQKRRRVTRACDECRRKKIKCDGKQPCTHCTVYSYECTYDQPSNRRRNPAPQYVENLEHRVHRAETLLHLLIPKLDLNDPGIDAAVAQGWIPGGAGERGLRQAQEPRQQKQPPQSLRLDDAKPDTNIESMVRAVAQIDMDEVETGLPRPFVRLEFRPEDARATRRLDGWAIDDAAALLRHIHRPTFWQSFEHLYSVPPEQYTDEDHRFLPLFHSAMALGHLFGKDEDYESAIREGFVHFKTARQLMDIADCRDLTSIQAVIMMIMFLQSSAKLSQCYAYVGVALRSALRMGLHRNYRGNFDPIEAETRKRVFWVVRKMDIYVGAMLGLPQTLSDEDIDQEFPAEVDDEYVTKAGILPMPEGQVPIMTAFNAHTRLVQLLSKIVRCVYPIKIQGDRGSDADKTYSVPFSTIREIESEMEQWKNDLPSILNPCPAPARYARVQQLLRLSYAHAQVMLYRPFLHFVSMEKRAKPVDQRAYACAASYVNVSRNMVHILAQMKQKGMLNGAFWFVMYTSFFAILSLVYFAAENPDNPTTEAVMKDALEGKEVLASLSQRSMAADRCTATLDVVFKRLPEWMRKGQQNPIMSKKRHFDAGPDLLDQNSLVARSNTDRPNARRPEPMAGLQRRAGTFPRPGDTNPVSPSYDTWSPSGSTTIGPQTPTGKDFHLGAYMNYNSMNASNAISQGLQQYSLPPNNANPAIADLSTMMFPAQDEPFGYPNQPLTTFENNQQFSDKDPYPSQPYSGVEPDTQMVAPSTRRRDDNMEAQFFALPPYLEQRRQQEPFAMGYANGSPDFNTDPQLGTPTTIPQMSDGWPGSQQSPMQQGGDMTNINIQDIFGGTEWNSMLLNGFQPQ